jgi:hypothetical protein
VATRRFPRGAIQSYITVNSWAVDEVKNLERGGNLERGQPIFSLATLWRATKSQFNSLLAKPMRGKFFRELRRKGRNP